MGVGVSVSVDVDSGSLCDNGLTYACVCICLYLVFSYLLVHMLSVDSELYYSCLDSLAAIDHSRGREAGASTCRQALGGHC